MRTINNLIDMKDRNVLITGAFGHIGRKITKTLYDLGARLILVDHPSSDMSLEKSINYENHFIFKCDFESAEDRIILINKIKSKITSLSCLINNAAFVGTSNLDGWACDFEDQSTGTWRRALEVNLITPFHLSREFQPELLRGKGANIINITSIYSEFGPDWSLYENTNIGNPAAYSASKGGLTQLTRWLSTTVSPNIRVNAVSPGGIFRNQSDFFVKKYEDKVPLKRMATEKDICGAIIFLATDMSEYITGQIIRVDGGLSSTI